MTSVVLVAAAALLLALSPGLALILVAIALFALDAHDPRILDSLRRTFTEETRR